MFTRERLEIKCISINKFDICYSKLEISYLHNTLDINVKIGNSEYYDIKTFHLYPSKIIIQELYIFNPESRLGKYIQ